MVIFTATIGSKHLEVHVAFFQIKIGIYIISWPNELRYIHLHVEELTESFSRLVAQNQPTILR